MSIKEFLNHAKNKAVEAYKEYEAGAPERHRKKLERMKRQEEIEQARAGVEEARSRASIAVSKRREQSAKAEERLRRIDDDRRRRFEEGLFGTNDGQGGIL